MGKIIKIIKKPTKLFMTLGHYGFLNFIDDETYLKIAYKINLGMKLDLNNPKRYNEKIQWLKLHDRQPIYTTLVDKYTVKEYVKNILGEDLIIPTIGVYNNFDEIEFNNLPSKFVIKCTHDSGGNIVCTNKSNLDIHAAKKKIERCLKMNFYYSQREWPYKDVKPRIIIEKYMVDESNSELKDYKFFCFNGEVKYLFIATDRMNEKSDTKFDFYDRNFKHLDIKNGHENSNKKIIKPLNFDKMIEIAEKLSYGIPHVRIDLYNINGKIYFGEYTFYHWSGFTKFEPDYWDFEFGKLIDLGLVKDKL